MRQLLSETGSVLSLEKKLLFQNQRTLSNAKSKRRMAKTPSKHAGLPSKSLNIFVLFSVNPRLSKKLVLI